MQLSHLLIKHAPHLLNILPLTRTDKQTVLVQLRHPSALQLLQRHVLTRRRCKVISLLLHPPVSINLVKDNHRRLLSTTQVAQRLLNNSYLLLKIRVRDIYHMQQQVCLAHLVQRRFERINQICRQLADKPDSVSQQKRQVPNRHLTHGRVKRRKKFVLSKHLTLRQQVHNRRFANIRITHQRHTNQPPAVLTLRRLLPVDFRETLLQQRDALTDDTLVHLQLRLARTPQAHTSLAAA